MLAIWIQFGVCAAVIAVAGSRLSRYGDVIADKTGLSGSWIGLVLLATVTSLPELVTGISAVTVADAPNIAVGDALGSCVLNLAILVILDFLHRGESVYRRASQGHILSAAFGSVLLGIIAFNLLLGPRAAAPAIWHVGLYSPMLAALYLLAARTLLTYERRELRESAAATADRYPELTLRQAATGYTFAAGAVMAAGAWLPFVGADLADAMGWHHSFVGTLFVAAATSLPELVVTLTALRIGALDMAIANLLGSNLFDALIVAIDDLFYLPGPLLAAVSPTHAISAVSALVMNGIATVGLLYRPSTRFFRGIGWVSLALLAAYLLNAYVVFLHDK